VQIQLQVNSAVVYSAETGPDGYAQFKDLEAGHYELVATKEGFEAVRKGGLDLIAAGSISVELILVPAQARRESIEVNASAAPIEQGGSSADSLPPQCARELPGRPATVADALGIRAESQEISESFRVAPRAGIAWTPFARTGTVFRGGLGLFCDRVPLNVYSFNHYPNQLVTWFDPKGTTCAAAREAI
jgi:hypothetical protein